MRENSSRNIPSPLDHETMDEIYRPELTRTDSDSDSSSDVTVESSRLNGNATPSRSAEWTNEKHNAYLDFLEASFVQQLHGSTGLGRWRSQEQIWGPYSSKPLSANAHSSSGRLMVLRDGYWQKITSELNEPLYDNAAVYSHTGLENPWIRRFTSIGKHQTATTFHPQKHGILCDDGLSSTEISDQNFVDEDRRDKSSFRPMAKRSRTAAVGDSSDDQVVPIENLHTTNVSTVKRDSSEIEELSHHELL